MKQLLVLESKDLDALRRGERIELTIGGESVLVEIDGVRAPRVASRTEPAPTRKRKRMSRAARLAAAKRMKAYWAARRRNGGKP